jgi:hypothetical protein
VQAVSRDSFGLLIAYLVPGFIVVWAIQPLSPTLAGWLAITPTDAPTVGGFLYATIAATGAGLTVSALRWAVLDQLFHRTGIPPPPLDFGRLQEHLAAFESHVEDHYRYYQAYSNGLLALILAYAIRVTVAPASLPVWMHVSLPPIALLLILSSRDALKKYFARTAALLGSGLAGDCSGMTHSAAPDDPE